MAHGNKSLSALANKYRGKPKKFAEGGRARRPAAAPVAFLYAEGGLAELDQKYAGAPTVRAPKEANIRGQGHELAYITPEEAELLKARGGSGRMTRYGVPAFDDGGDGGGGGDGNGGDGDGGNGSNGNEGGNGTGEGNQGATGQDAANSEASTQDAAEGNAGQGAGPTGAGAGGGPTSNDPGPTGEGQSEVSTPGMAPGISTTPTAVGPIGPEDEANAAAAREAIANAPIGFEAYGVRDAIDAYNSGRMGLAQAIGYGLANVAAPPGVSVGFNVDPQTQTQTPAVSVDPVAAAVGLGLSAATGFAPGVGMLGSMLGANISQAMGMTPGVMDLGTFGVTAPSMSSQAPGVNSTGNTAQGIGTSTADGLSGGSGSSGEESSDGDSSEDTGNTTSGLSSVASAQSNAQGDVTSQTAPLGWDWMEIQRQAAMRGMDAGQYLATQWRNMPIGMPMKKGGAVKAPESIEDMHARYAEGGEVEGPEDGFVRPYDPREIDALASEFMAETSPSDLMQRGRMLMRGANVGMRSNIGAHNLSDNENVSNYTGLREMPIEDDRFARALQTLNTGINATLDQERGIRLGAGLQAMQDAGDRGMSGYGANLSAGYGPVSLHGGYQTQMQAHPGAKPQGVYTYGGNLNIPLDDEGTRALLGAQVMSGRRGSAGMGNAGTLITGGLERPFLDGTLGVDVSVDPTLRNKEILFGYRRAF